jgi:hypothetical protein
MKECGAEEGTPLYFTATDLAMQPSYREYGHQFPKLPVGLLPDLSCLCRQLLLFIFINLQLVFFM